MKKLFYVFALIGIAVLTSCEKEEADSLVQSDLSKRISLIYFQDKPMRKYDAEVDPNNCINIEENCAPEDVVLDRTGSTFERLLAFNAAMREGGAVVAEFFNDPENALSIIPDWDEEYFAPVKEAILSGGYNFEKEERGEKEIYFLGEDGIVSSSNYEYVLVFNIVE
ncbi:MAG: hypothetical protein AB7D46_05880 [Flavobacteriaceae bacterium]